MSDDTAGVILVDDDLSVRRALRRLLVSAGYRVELFASVDGFLAGAQVRRPACLVLDVRMPGKTGFDLHDILTARGSDLPVIFISGHDDPGTEVRAMKAGAVCFLPKPLDAEALLAAVKRAIAVDRKGRVEAGENRT